MIENPEEVMLQRFGFGEAIHAGLLNLQLRWGISMANALELDGMDRLSSPLSGAKQGLIAHDEGKIARVSLELMSITCRTRRPAGQWGL